MNKIKLLIAHTHAGVLYQAGDVLEVDDADAAFIVKLNIGEKINSADKSEKTKQGE